MTHLRDEKNKFMRPLPILNHPDSFKNLKICVLQPDYSTSGVDYQNYDPKEIYRPYYLKQKLIMFF